ncbi:hypothetical protein PCE1_000081 [Barthelona sp. PCE]
MDIVVDDILSGLDHNLSQVQELVYDRKLEAAVSEAEKEPVDEVPMDAMDNRTLLLHIKRLERTNDDLVSISQNDKALYNRKQSKLKEECESLRDSKIKLEDRIKVLEEQLSESESALKTTKAHVSSLKDELSQKDESLEQSKLQHSASLADLDSLNSTLEMVMNDSNDTKTQLVEMLNKTKILKDDKKILYERINELQKNNEDNEEKIDRLIRNYDEKIASVIYKNDDTIHERESVMIGHLTEIQEKLDTAVETNDEWETKYVNLQNEYDSLLVDKQTLQVENVKIANKCSKLKASFQQLLDDVRLALLDIKGDQHKLQEEYFSVENELGSLIPLFDILKGVSAKRDEQSATMTRSARSEVIQSRVIEHRGAEDEIRVVHGEHIINNIIGELVADQKLNVVVVDKLKIISKTHNTLVRKLKQLEVQKERDDLKYERTIRNLNSENSTLHKSVEDSKKHNSELVGECRKEIKRLKNENVELTGEKNIYKTELSKTKTFNEDLAATKQKLLLSRSIVNSQRASPISVRSQTSRIDLSSPVSPKKLHNTLVNSSDLTPSKPTNTVLMTAKTNLNSLVSPRTQKLSISSTVDSDSEASIVVNHLLKLNQPIVSIVGAGGKTTMLYYLAKKLKRVFNRILVTTTTNLEPFEDGVVDHYFDHMPSISEIRSCNGVVGIIKQERMKEDHVSLKGFSFEEIDELTPWFDAVLIESDGSRDLPFKAPSEKEPCIHPRTNVVIGVVGADCIGKRVSDMHRPEHICNVAKCSANDLVTCTIINEVLHHPSGTFKNTPEEASKFLVINKCDTYVKQAYSFVNIVERGFKMIYHPEKPKERRSFNMDKYQSPLRKTLSILKRDFQ